MESIIVSRHPAAVEFLKEERPDLFGDAPVVESATLEDVRGKVVGGNLPLNLAAEAHLVYSVLFDGPPPRGQEYGVTEMREAGAYIAPFRVEAGEGTVCPFCQCRHWSGWHCPACGAL